MNFYLYYKDCRTLQFAASLFPDHIEVKEATILNKEKLPLSIRTGKDTVLDLYKWLSGRMIPNENKDLDAICEKELDMDHNHCRLFGYQHLVSLIHYYVTPYDDYSVVPEKGELLYLGTYTPNLSKLFTLQHDAYKNIDSYRTVYTVPLTNYDNMSINPANIRRWLYEYNDIVLDGNTEPVAAYKNCLLDEFGEDIRPELPKITLKTEPYNTVVIVENNKPTIYSI